MNAGRRNFLAILAGAAVIGGSIFAFGVRDTALQLPNIMPGQIAPPCVPDDCQRGDQAALA